MKILQYRQGVGIHAAKGAGYAALGRPNCAQYVNGLQCRATFAKYTCERFEDTRFL
jgi:hypothetical protein